MNPNLKNHFDIVIVGAGLMGSTLAAALMNSRFKIALIDRQLPHYTPTKQNQFALRVNAYNRASETLLREVGVWEMLPNSRIFPFTKVVVCSETQDSGVRFCAKDLHQTHIGHFIENQLVNTTLIERIKKAENISIIKNIEIDDIEYDESSISVTTKDGNHFSSRLLVGCDGGNSFIRKKQNIDTIELPYRQHCIVGTLHFSGDLDGMAWQRFIPTGPVGLLPLAQGYASLAWTNSVDRMEEMRAFSEEDFIAHLAQWMPKEVGKLISLKTRADFPLIAKHAVTYTGYRTALVGDAAHVIHPLAGFGANLGFRDVAVLARNLLHSTQEDVGNSKILSAYELARRYHNTLFSTAMTTINNVFTNDLPILKQSRSVGLGIANKIWPVKNLFLRQAMWMSFSPQKNLLKL